MARTPELVRVFSRQPPMRWDPSATVNKNLRRTLVRASAVLRTIRPQQHLTGRHERNTHRPVPAFFVKIRPLVSFF